MARTSISTGWLRSGAAAVGVCLVLTACATGNGATPAASGGKLVVVAAEDFWGSIAQQVGGDEVSVTSIITNPNADPHDYEPTAEDARLIAGAGLMILNGIGYDPWTQKLLDANPVSGRAVLDVGDLVEEPVGGNPHQWYSPSSVETVIGAITAEYEKQDPAAKSTFESLQQQFLTQGLRSYLGEIQQIKATYAGTKVGASESIFAEMAPALGLDLITPGAFLKAISEGIEPAAADKSTIDHQIQSHEIQTYVYNSQNATPDIQRQISACNREAIPVTTITETLVPQGATFQQWQVRELEGIREALHQATGR